MAMCRDDGEGRGGGCSHPKCSTVCQAKKAKIENEKHGDNDRSRFPEKPIRTDLDVTSEGFVRFFASVASPLNERDRSEPTDKHFRDCSKKPRTKRRSEQSDEILQIDYFTDVHSVRVRSSICHEASRTTGTLLTID